MRLIVICPLLFACSTGKLSVGDSSLQTGGDQGTDTGGTTDSEDPEDSPVDSTPPEPVPDMSQYAGLLSFSYETWGYSCEGDEVTEVGTLISADDYPGLQDACPACDYFYRAQLDRDQVCDWIRIVQDDLRGVVLGDDWAQVYRFDEADGGYAETLLDNGATFDGWTINFSSSFNYYGVDVQVEGSYTYPEL